jgi:proteasome lid subunit RPN8/RPN11
MKWSEREPDARPEDLRHVLASLDCGTAIRFYLNWQRGVRFYVSEDCERQVLRHVRSDRREVGGLLLGRVWSSGQGAGMGEDPIVVIQDSVASEECINSAVSLEMSTEVWSRANLLARAESLVVGWYHSHPDLGAFFSGTDRRTQAAFFTQPYSIGWVIDPIRGQEKLFSGPSSLEYPHDLVRIDPKLFGCPELALSRDSRG